MTNRERLEWACGVLNLERYRGYEWAIDPPLVGRLDRGFGGRPPSSRIIPPQYSGFEAVAIALTLDEQARRRLPEREQAEWAASVLGGRRHNGHTDWAALHMHGGGSHVEPLTGVSSEKLSLPDAFAIAESYVRREMLSQETEEVSQ